MPAPSSSYSSDFYIYKGLDIVYDTCKIHPNIITGVGMLLTPFIAYFMIHKQKWLALFTGILCFLLDCLDGMVARKCALQTKSGEIFDHLSDIIKIIALTSIWMYQLNTPYQFIGMIEVFLSIISYNALFSSAYSSSFSNSAVHDNLMIIYVLLWYIWVYSLGL